MSITYNGPWDYDGSPTDMTVEMGFMPSEFYDSTSNKIGLAGASKGTNTAAAGGTFASSDSGQASLMPKTTVDGATEVTGNNPYALWVGEGTFGQSSSNQAFDMKNVGMAALGEGGTSTDATDPNLVGSKVPVQWNLTDIATKFGANSVSYDPNTNRWTMQGGPQDGKSFSESDINLYMSPGTPGPPAPTPAPAPVTTTPNQTIMGQ